MILKNKQFANQIVSKCKSLELEKITYKIENDFFIELIRYWKGINS